jgi:hypothetical protein
MTTFLYLMLVALSGSTKAGAAGENCPPAYERSEMRVHGLLSSPLAPEMRRRFDLGTSSADDVHLLANSRDRETCVTLWQAVRASGTVLSPGDRVAFYRSGDTFFVPISRKRAGRPGAIQLDGNSSLDVYNSRFQLVGRFTA